MSAEAFSRLSLGGTMVTTRAGAARAQTARPSSKSSTSSSGDSAADQADIISDNELKYGTVALDEKVRRRAELAFSNSIIQVNYCFQSDGPPTEYHFALYDSITVTMGNPDLAPRCTCGANDDQAACRHIFWLEDQILQFAPPSVTTKVLQLSQDGASINDMKAADLINNFPGKLERVSTELECTVLESSAHNAQQEEDHADKVGQELVDLLSAFEPSKAFAEDLEDPNTLSTLPGPSQKYKLFVDAIIEQAKHDVGFCSRLQDVFDPNFRTQAFFDKIDDRINRTFKALEEYIAHGSATSHAEAYSVVVTAGKLKDLVGRIVGYYIRQAAESAEWKAIAIHASAALLKILDGITSRNYDAYAHIQWPLVAPEDVQERNLFVYLLAQSEGDELFIIDVLREHFPLDDVLRYHWNLLNKIRENLETNSNTPRFLNAFISLTSESRKRANPEEAGSSAKRTMK